MISSHHSKSCGDASNTDLEKLRHFLFAYKWVSFINIVNQIIQGRDGLQEREFVAFFHQVWCLLKKGNTLMEEEEEFIHGKSFFDCSVSFSFDLPPNSPSNSLPNVKEFHLCPRKQNIQKTLPPSFVWTWETDYALSMPHH